MELPKIQSEKKTESSLLKCFIAYSDVSLCKNIENILFQVKRSLKDSGYIPILLREQITSEEDYYLKVNNVISECVMGIVILDGFRANILFEFGIIKGMEKCVLIAQSKDAKYQVINLYKSYLESGLQKAKFNSLKNPDLSVDLHFSDFKGKHICYFDDRFPNRIYNIFKDQIEKKEKCVQKYLNDKISQQTEKSERYSDLFIELSYSFFNSKDYTSAMAITEKGIEIFPDKKELYYRKGTISRKLEDFDKAEESYFLALKLDKNYVDALNALGNIYVDLKLYDKAKKFFENALKLDNTNAKVWSNYGILYSELNELDEAEKCFRKSLNSNKNYVIAKNNLCLLLRKTKRYEELEQLMEEILKEDPSNLPSLLIKVEILQENEDYSSSVPILTKLISDNPKNALIYGRMALAQYFQSNLTPAMENIKKAIQIDTKTGIFYYIMGIIYQENHQFDEAIRSFYEAIKIDPINPHYILQLIDLYSEYDRSKIPDILDRFKNEIQKFHAFTLNFDFSHIPDVIILIRILIIEGNIELALKYFNRIIELKPDNFDNYNLIAWSLYLANSLDLAEEFSLKSMKSKEISKEYLDTLGSIYMKKGNYEEAKNSFQKALEIAPNYKLVIRKIEEIKKREEIS